ncbi:unnamed protein product [Nezara viridula]|uniref:Uncharacterized protein n=1 Tax=Nezara viridula TaxID=85310 RepID=A0A9P0EGK1_NEZVI|nr:unnamed protein product [Nezara viridula]
MTPTDMEQEGSPTPEEYNGYSSRIAAALLLGMEGFLTLLLELFVGSAQRLDNPPSLRKKCADKRIHRSYYGHCVVSSSW